MSVSTAKSSAAAPGAPQRPPAPGGTRQAYWLGVREGLPFVLVILPFGLLFGVVAAEAGLNLLEAVSFSVLVIAGAAQFTALQLLSDQAPALIALVSALAVNLRMAMYSATMAAHIGGAPLWKRAIAAYVLVDQTFAAASLRYEREPAWGHAEKTAYFFGAASPIYLPWLGATMAGALLGSTIPESLALDFALPITFLAMIGPMLRTLPHVIAAGVAVTLALLLAGMPYNLGLLVAGLAGMAAGAEAERRLMPQVAP